MSTEAKVAAYSRMLQAPGTAPANVDERMLDDPDTADRDDLDNGLQGTGPVASLFRRPDEQARSLARRAFPSAAGVVTLTDVQQASLHRLFDEGELGAAVMVGAKHDHSCGFAAAGQMMNSIVNPNCTIDMHSGEAATMARKVILHQAKQFWKRSQVDFSNACDLTFLQYEALHARPPSVHRPQIRRNGRASRLP